MLDIILQLSINGLLMGGIYGLVAIGLCLIFGVLGVVNFAHGEFLMLGMYATYWLFHFFGIDPYISIIIIVPVFFFIGMVVQRILIQPILEASFLSQIFVTLGLSIVLQNMALLVWKADYRTIRVAYSSKMINIGNLLINYPRLINFCLALIAIFFLFIFLKNTFVGKAIRALSQERRAAMLIGININRIYQVAFGLGIACVGIASAALMPIYYAFPTVGTLFTLTAFVVVILGGYNSLIGSLIGGLIIGLVESFSGYFIDPALKEVTYFVIFIIILLVKPNGLFGQKEN